jgi:hypothetical protein
MQKYLKDMPAGLLIGLDTAYSTANFRRPPAFAGAPPPRTTAVVAALVSITSSLSRPRHPGSVSRPQALLSAKDKCQLLTYTMNQIAGSCQMSLADIKVNGR